MMVGDLARAPCIEAYTAVALTPPNSAAGKGFTGVQY
jgi:hypothetical protein